MRRHRIPVMLLCLACSAQLWAQPAAGHKAYDEVRSLGFPTIWKPYFTPMVGWDRRASADRIAGELNLGVYRDLQNPLMGLLGIAGEAYVRSPGDRVDGGGRLFGTSRVFYIQAGIDYSMRYGEVDFALSIQGPMRRGGPLGRGGNLRIDWLPGRGNSINFGLTIPIGQPHLGKTRPRKDYVSLPEGKLPSRTEYSASAILGEAMAHVRHAAEWISRYTTPCLDPNTGNSESQLAAFRDRLSQWTDHIGLGHTFQFEVDTYHRELERAFSLALREGETAGPGARVPRLADRARQTLLEEVILPYNRFIGWRKKHDSVLGFGVRATRMFEAWVQAQQDIPPADRAAVNYVFRSLLDYVESSRRFMRDLWQDQRLEWIPLHYALRFEDLDTEDELDALIEQALGRPFIEANDVHYVLNELFQAELERMIRAARDYHVLWVHDYTGVTDFGLPDSIGYRLAVDVYLGTLTERVRQCDDGGSIPTYMIFLDQHYYERHQSKLWLELLADPLHHRVQLPDGYGDWEKRIRAVQKELIEAVAASATLQDSVRQFGQSWVRDRIKVHVSITNPSDLSFRSRLLLRYIPFTPDNIMRDHRKIVFYDVTERDPSKGEAMYSGMGVGEHYLGSMWDDRSILVRGPTLVSLKDAAREMLRSQGFASEDIPPPLRPLPFPGDYDAMVEELRAEGWTASALEVHNATGFGPKPATLAKAILYSAMPNGSHLYVPDALWISPFWGSMLVGAAMRGCVVLLISPALAHAPSAGAPQMSEANELFTRLLIIQDEMQETFDSTGGMLRVGVYDADLEVGDLAGKIRRLYDQLANDERFRRVFPFDSSVVELVGRMPGALEAQGFKPDYTARDELTRRPQLHLKSQFFASATAINTITPLKGWTPVVQKYSLARVAQVTRAGGNTDAKDLRALLETDIGALYAEWMQGRSSEEREQTILYLTVGSHNQDYRSMIMDGEALFVVGRRWALVAYLDFVSLVGQATWIDSPEELEVLLPRHTDFWRWLGRSLRIAL